MSNPTTCGISVCSTHAVCGSVYAGLVMCLDTPGHADDHTAPVGDDDSGSVWAWNNER